MQIKTVKTVDLLDVLYALQEAECKELGIPVPQRGNRIKLPDGREDIKQRLWDELREDQWGNQQFCNDSFYRVPFEQDGTGEVYTDDLSEDMLKLLDYCRPALNDDGGFSFILFDVSW